MKEKKKYILPSILVYEEYEDFCVDMNINSLQNADESRQTKRRYSSYKSGIDWNNNLSNDVSDNESIWDY